MKAGQVPLHHQLTATDCPVHTCDSILYTNGYYSPPLARPPRRAPFTLLGDPILPRALQVVRLVGARIHFVLNCGAASCPTIKVFVL